MKRTTLALMTVLVLAVLGGGRVGPSWAQTLNCQGFGIIELDCTVISGVSGRSVREGTEYTKYYVWLWTAPATGSVTFDTRGSGASLQLSVLTGDPPVVVARKADEVQFTAQMGVQYVIGHSVVEETATTAIVLNWRAA